MSDPVFSFFMEIIGAFIVWASKGFKGKLNDEMSGPHESSKKSWRNALISILLLIIVVAIAGKIIDNQKEVINDNKFELIIKK
jgi:Na+/H+ antiporter NhaC